MPGGRQGIGGTKRNIFRHIKELYIGLLSKLDKKWRLGCGMTSPAVGRVTFLKETHRKTLGEDFSSPSVFLCMVLAVLFDAGDLIILGFHGLF